MKSLLMATVLMFSTVSFAKEVRLICMMGDIADMDIVLQSFEAPAKERLKVLVYGMDGETITIFQNSKFKNGSLFNSYKKGNLSAIVSTSDLENSFGGAYLNAGMLEMTYNSTTKKYDVLFAAQNTVYTAACTPQ